MNAPIPQAAIRFSIADIAKALDIHRTNAVRRAEKELWPFEEAAVRGGKKRLYRLDTLPKDVREAVMTHSAIKAAEALPAIPAVVAKALPIIPAQDRPLKDSQRSTEIARDRIFEFVARFGGSEPRAIDFLNVGYAQKTLPGPMMWALDNAWSKRRADTRLTRNTLNKWKEAKKARGHSAPLVRQKDLEIKPWYALLLALRQRPQGSSLVWIAEEIKNQWDPAWGAEPPSYSAIRRVCVEKLSAIDQLKGRFTGSQLRSLKHWSPRTSEGMYPWQEVHADGWNTHFTAPHPITGEFVTYEVWHFHDVATRFVTPPGIGLTETYEVITSGLERCVRFGGMMAILQTDSTKVVKRSPRFTADPFAALSERAGFTVVHPKEVGNSQANGICENFNTSWLDKQARALATYQGKGMDSLTLKRVKKITERMIKAAKAGDLVERDRLHREAEKTGKGRVFLSYQEGEEWINATVEAFNDRPHRSLPKISDPVTGKRRHQTPREALQQHIDDGWDAITNGRTFGDFIKTLRPQLKAKGWWGIAHDPETGEIQSGRAMTPHRLGTIYQTNLQSSYMAGRYKAQLENADRRPYWKYIAILDARTRPRHRALHGRIFRYDDPIWGVIYPPNGYRCRCRVVALSQEDFDAEGGLLSKGGDFLETREIPVGKNGRLVPVTGYKDPQTGEWFAPDPGFDTNPGAGYGRDIALARRVQALPNREIRTQVWQALNNSPARLADYHAWMNRTLGTARPGNSAQVIGFVEERLADFMRKQLPDDPPIRIVAINEKRLVHADSQKHAEGGIGMTRDQYAMLPGIVAKPDAIYFDKTHQNFVFVRDLADGGVIYAALDTADALKRVGKIDVLINAYRLDASANGAGRLADGNRFVKMGDR